MEKGAGLVAGCGRVFRAGGRVREKNLPQPRGARMQQLCNKFVLDFWVGTGCGALRHGVKFTMRARAVCRDLTTGRLGDWGQVGGPTSRQVSKMSSRNLLHKCCNRFS